MVRTMAPCEDLARVKLIKPGPAISTFSIMEFPEIPLCTTSAISRGDLLATFANAKAIEVA